MRYAIYSYEHAWEKLQSKRLEYQEDYRAMFSTWLGGIVVDPQAMLIPVDDHLVHRGDGVFEAFKCLNKKIYMLEQHLDRLERSSAKIGIQWPMPRQEVEAAIKATIHASGLTDTLIRLYMSRGPGGFTTNPYESVGSQLYLVATVLRTPGEKIYQQGVKAISSRIAVKDGFFSSVKSCNYLPNVLMKKEAVDNKVDYTIGQDENGFLCEGSTENMAILTQDNGFLVPGFGRTLEGTTLTRLMKLLQPLVDCGELHEISNCQFRVEDALQAKEFFMIGTTIDVVPVVEFNGQKINDGVPGPWCQRFNDIIQKDMQSGPMTTPI